MSLSPRLRTVMSLAAGPALVIALGCAAKPTPVGKWSGSVANVGQTTIEFKKD